MDFTLPSTGYSSISITVNAKNNCSIDPGSNAAYYLVKKTCLNLMVEIYPNPATSELNIETSEVNDSTNLQTQVIADEVILLDMKGSVLTDEFPNESDITIDTRKIPKGDYFLHVKYGDKIIEEHITIQK